MIKYFQFISALGFLVLVSTSAALACPGFEELNPYTEISLPCTGLSPDYAQAPSINQRTTNGGECRVVAQAGQSFVVRDLTLLMITADKQVVRLGTLLTPPSCYQTEPGEGYRGAWVPVQLSRE